MDFNPQELGQVAQFKELVLSAADAQRTQIIADAQRQSDSELADAREKCRLASPDVVAEKVAADIERQASAATQTARRQLLAARQALVEGLFADAEKQLLAFTKANGYAAWLAQKLTAHTKTFAKAKSVVVYLRKADMPHAAALQKALPGCTVQADDSIRLGGLKAACGQILYDETLDTALAAEWEDFTNTSGLHL